MYVQEIYETFLASSKKDLADAAVKLKGMCPPPMNTMLSKQTKQEALKKRSDRSQIIIHDVPPSIPGNTFIPMNVFFIMCSIFSHKISLFWYTLDKFTCQKLD